MPKARASWGRVKEGPEAIFHPKTGTRRPDRAGSLFLMGKRSLESAATRNCPLNPYERPANVTGRTWPRHETWNPTWLLCWTIGAAEAGRCSVSPTSADLLPRRPLGPFPSAISPVQSLACGPSSRDGACLVEQRISSRWFENGFGAFRSSQMGKRSCLARCSRICSTP